MPRTEIENPGDSDPPLAHSASAGGEPPSAGEPPKSSIASRTLRGSAWTVLGYGGGQALRVASNLVLTRLLFPEAFGTMAIINALVIGLHLFSDVGITPAIIQNKRGDDPEFLNTAWTIQVMRGFGLFLVACLLAYPASQFYNDPRLLLLIPTAALTTIFDGLSSTKMITLHRHLALGKFTLIELAAQAVTSVVMICWALLYPSLWALVGGTLVGNAVRMVASHRLTGPPNRLHWNPTIARELFSFGKWIFLSTLLTFVGEHCDRLVFGKIATLELLGVYNIALMVALMPTNAIAHVGASVFFPAFSRTIEEGGDFRGSFRSTRSALSIGGGYFVAGMIAAGQPAMAILYDERYAAAGWMLQLLAVGSWFHIMECSTGAAILALGRVKWLAAANFAKALGLMTLLPIGFTLHGFPGALVGLSLASVAKYVVVTVAAHRNQLAVIRSDLIVSSWVATSGIGVFWIGQQLAAQGAADLTVLLATIAATTLLWSPCGLALWRYRR